MVSQLLQVTILLMWIDGCPSKPFKKPKGERLTPSDPPTFRSHRVASTVHAVLVAQRRFRLVVGGYLSHSGESSGMRLTEGAAACRD